MRLSDDAFLVPVQNGFDPELESRNHAGEGIASFVSECERDRPVTRITRPGSLHIGGRRSISAEERAERKIASLPGSLSEAMRELDKNDIIKEALGPEIYAAFERAKWAEIDEHRTRVSDWEIERYLETA